MKCLTRSHVTSQIFGPCEDAVALIAGKWTGTSARRMCTFTIHLRPSSFQSECSLSLSWCRLGGHVEKSGEGAKGKSGEVGVRPKSTPTPSVTSTCVHLRPPTPTAHPYRMGHGVVSGLSLVRCRVGSSLQYLVGPRRNAQSSCIPQASSWPTVLLSNLHISFAEWEEWTLRRKD